MQTQEQRYRKSATRIRGATHSFIRSLFVDSGAPPSLRSRGRLQARGTWERGNVGTWERGNVERANARTWERGNVGTWERGNVERGNVGT